jgi:probable F420-dependent oxidoreductase
MPSIEAGLRSSGRTRQDFELSYPAFVITGQTQQEIAQAADATRKQIAFYASTPAYRPVLELHGWGELQSELNTLSKRGEWDEMGQRIEDEVLEAFAVRGTPDELPELLAKRFDGLIDRISLYLTYRTGGEVVPRVVAGLKAV